MASGMCLAKAAKLTDPVAAKELERTDLSNPAIGAEHRAAITAAGDVLKKADIARAAPTFRRLP